MSFHLTSFINPQNVIRQVFDLCLISGGTSRFTVLPSFLLFKINSNKNKNVWYTVSLTGNVLKKVNTFNKYRYSFTMKIFIPLKNTRRIPFLQQNLLPSLERPNSSDSRTYMVTPRTLLLCLLSILLKSP